MVVTVDDEERHRSHFVLRAHETRNRPSERDLDFFDNTCKLQKHTKSLALQHSVPAVPSYDLDATRSQVIDLAVGQSMQAVAPPTPAPREHAHIPNSPIEASEVPQP